MNNIIEMKLTEKYRIKSEDLFDGAHGEPVLYKGVLVQWDEDYDQRIFTFINELSAENRARLAIAHEHEGVLSLRWLGLTPPGYEDGDEVVVEEDAWYIVDSESIQPDQSLKETRHEG